MALTTAFAIYFLIWWIILFAVLPWGIRTQEEEGNVEPGSAPSAPANPQLLKKVIATSIVAAIIFAVFYWGRTSGWIALDNIPFLPERRY